MATSGAREHAAIDDYGISATAPPGWDLRISRGVLYAASFPLPKDPRSAGYRRILGRLGRDDALVSMFENDRELESPPLDLSEYDRLSTPPQFAISDLGRPEVLEEAGVPDDQGYARRTFSLAGRLFVLFVHVGAREPSRDLLGSLNALLASVDVRAGDFYSGTVEPATFTSRDGWTIGTHGPALVRADGEWTSSWASTIAYRNEWNELPPQQTLERLPPDGIVIWVGLERNNRFAPAFRPREPPFRLSQFERDDGWEGQIGDVPQYRLWGTVRGEYSVDVRVYFGRQDPSKGAIAEADAMLAQLRFPEWGPWERA